jgi:antitoxin (DNA-binding transcriptional repressor) of toxin-antitoxin stability system
MITLDAIEFQKNILSILVSVQVNHEEVIVTNHGLKVAKLVPLELADGVDPLEAYRFPGKIEIHGDITAPCYSDEELEEFFEASAAQFKEHP